MRSWVRDRFEVYGRACLVAGVIVTPIFFMTSTVGVFGVAKLGMLWCLAVLGLAFWVIWRIDSPIAPPKSQVIRLAGIFLAIGALATTFSPYRITALIGAYYVYGGLVSLELYFVLAFLVFALYWRTPLQLQDLCRAGAIAGLGVAGYQLLQELRLDWNAWSAGSGAAPWEGGTLGNPNFTGGFLAATLPFVLYLTFSSTSTRVRRLLIAGSSAHAAALWLTASRGGIAAGLVGVATFAFIFRDLIPRRVKLAAGAIAALVLIAGVAIVVQRGGNGNGSTVLGVSTNPESLLETRLDFWRAAIGIIADHPILGTGPDTYYANYPAARPVANGADPNLQLENNPHNIFLSHGVGSGLAGLIAYLLLIGTVLRIGFKKLRASGPPAEQLLVATFMAVLAAYLTQGLVSVDHVPLAMLGWICIGALALLADPRVEDARNALESRFDTRPRRRRRLQVPVVATCLLAGVLLSLGARLVVADVKMRQAKSTTQFAEKLDLMNQASGLNPAESQYHQDAGTAWHTEGRDQPSENLQARAYSNARLEFLKAQALRPGTVLFMVSLARLESAWGDQVDRQHFVTAAAAWRSVIQHDPNNYRWHAQYGQMLGLAAAADNDNRALLLAQIEELRTAIRIQPGLPAVWAQLSAAYRTLGDTAQAAAVERAAPVQSVESTGASPPNQLNPAPARFGLTLAYVVPVVFGVWWIQRLRIAARRKSRVRSARASDLPEVMYEVLAVAGIWSAAVVVPHMGVLLGAGLSPGDTKELLLHLLPGAGPIFMGARRAVRRYASGRRSAMDSFAQFATFVSTLVALLLHLPPLAGGGVKALQLALAHMTPLAVVLILVTLTISRITEAEPEVSGDTDNQARESADIA